MFFFYSNLLLFGNCRIIYVRLVTFCDTLAAIEASLHTQTEMEFDSYLDFQKSLTVIRTFVQGLGFRGADDFTKSVKGTHGI